MVTEDHKLTEALEQVRTALAAMGSGNPEPYITRLHRRLRAGRGGRG
jgi:hypothetical protein